jgi:metallophosphoesterase (TIGR00282 family)
MPQTKENKELRILFIGDIVGEVGRNAVKKLLPRIKEKQAVDFTIANGEHLSERVGLDIEYVNEMHQAGVDLFTTGNHVWRKKEFEEHIGRADVPVIRPANFAGSVPGDGFRIVRTKKGNLLVANLIGQEHIEARGILQEEGTQRVNSPFDVADKILSETKGYRYSLLDFHAEMTSEKVAMGQYLDGRYGAVLGTHTHVPTADNQILANGTAYVTDVGMTGPRDSVLGVKSEIIIERFRNGLPQRFEVAEGRAVFNAVLITFGENGKAVAVKRIDRHIS